MINNVVELLLVVSTIPKYSKVRIGYLNCRCLESSNGSEFVGCTQADIEIKFEGGVHMAKTTLAPSEFRQQWTELQDIEEFADKYPVFSWGTITRSGIVGLCCERGYY